MSEINLLDQYLQLNNPPCIAEIIEGETVVINLDTGNYYNLQGKSAVIWQALTNGVFPRKLATANDWDERTVDVFEKFIATSINEGIFKVVTAPPAHDVDLPVIKIDNPERDISLSIYSDMQELLGLDPIHEAHEVSGWPTKQ